MNSERMDWHIAFALGLLILLFCGFVTGCEKKSETYIVDKTTVTEIQEIKSAAPGSPSPSFINEEVLDEEQQEEADMKKRGEEALEAEDMDIHTINKIFSTNATTDVPPEIAPPSWKSD